MIRTLTLATWTVLVAMICALGGTICHASPPPWQRTEERAPCDDFSTLRSPYFGDLHVHTSFSHDAYLWVTRVEPRDAYAFARGGAVSLPDPGGAQTRQVQLERPLDFTAVTDHAEFLGEVRVCTTPGSEAYDDDLCVRLRDMKDEVGEQLDFILWGIPVGSANPPPSHALCDIPGVDCDAAAISVWQEVQQAAEEFYDRGSSCSFTTLIGYEHTASPSGSHLHRNVIFRNHHVPEFPTSYLETGQGGAAQPLWTALEQDCLNAGTGCDAVTIPHNSNLSGGLRWPDPIDAADARRRQQREPLVEIFQHKAGSECRFDRLAGAGVDTTDELCTFEQDPREREGPFPRPPIETYPRRNMVRNVLKDGLAFEQALGVNPFRLGFVGSTDTHNGTPGNTEEVGWVGHQGYSDADDTARVGTDVLGASRMRFNPGGLAVVWSEENSRDGLFAALARRETYATSGTRPVVRFFGGGLSGVRCGDSDFVARAYSSGTPMGGEIGPVRGRRSPRFAVMAVKDPGTAMHPGTDLQRVQIIKGWVDQEGQVHEKVYEVAGNPNSGAGVDPVTCAPVGTGVSELCTVWQDPEFDPDQRSYYYARLLENPTCRWSTLVCKSLGVDPFAPDCSAQAATAGEGLGDCCRGEADDAFMEPVIQERAWTSPIWYRPEAMAEVRGRMRFAPEAGMDRLKVVVRTGNVSSAFSPTADELTVRLTDDDEAYGVTFPPGTFTELGTGRFVYKDPEGHIGGVTRATLGIRPSGRGRLVLRAEFLNLGAADRTDHMITVRVNIGAYEGALTRLWGMKRRLLRAAL